VTTRRRNLRTQTDQELEEELNVARQTIPDASLVPSTIQTESMAGESQAVLLPAAVPVEVQSAVTELKRSKLGWKIRNDLIKAVKQIALDEDRHDYEVLEQILEDGIERWRQRDQQES